MSYMDRMVSIRDVSWVRNIDGTYTVTWVQDDQLHAETFKDDRSAFEFMRALDPTYPPPPPHEGLRERTRRMRAEMALAELEAQMAADEEAAAHESLHSLEPYAQRRANVRVRRHVRRKPSNK
jgi:hypothetical protein